MSTMSNITSTIISKIYKSRFNILEQLKERGYDISNYNDFNIHDVNTMFTNKTLDMLLKKDNSNVYVKYHLSKKITPNFIYNTINELFDIENILNKKNDQIIFIIKEEPNETMIKLCDQIYNSENIFITIYNIKRLQFNILEHQLVPKHIILNENEKKELIENYNIHNPKKMLPTISRFDPVAIAIGLRPNDICKITRPSKTSINSIYFRICV
jgi:DNA-directed RNA polymerase subunit H (RpoH/RPB5)